MLLRGQRRVVTRKSLVDRVWGHSESPSDGALEHQMQGLRRKPGSARIRTCLSRLSVLRFAKAAACRVALSQALAGADDPRLFFDPMRRPPMSIRTGLIVLALCVAPLAASAQQAAARVYAALYEQGPSYAQGTPLFEQRGVREHIAHHEALGARLIAAGPFRPKDGVPWVGMVLFSAASDEEAARWLEEDPAVRLGVLTARVLRWGVREVRSVP